MNRSERYLRPVLGSVGLHLAILMIAVATPLVLWWRSGPRLPPEVEFRPGFEVVAPDPTPADLPEVEVIPPDPAAAHLVESDLEPDLFDHLDPLPLSPLEAWPAQSALLRDPRSYHEPQRVPPHPSTVAVPPSAAPQVAAPKADPLQPLTPTTAGMPRTLPQPIASRSPLPPYPRRAQRLGWTGLVRVRVWVDVGGEVTDVRLEESSGHEILDQAALEAVKGWRFRPATENGQAVAGEAVVPLRFKRARQG